ncbi:MAG: LTA synthase family protein [Hyphomicrobiales bacterium]
MAGDGPPAPARGSGRLARFGLGIVKLCAAYLILLAVMAYLGQWTPDYLQGRDLWHFLFPRMVVAMVMLGVLASFIRVIPAALLLATMLLVIGTLSEIKRQSTGEPFQVSDAFLAGQSGALLGYVSWDKWLIAALLLPALYLAFRNLVFRAWSIPLALSCLFLLSTYRFEAVANWIHDNAYWIGVENLTFSQAESERMNGLATHLYFSTAGLRLRTFTDTDVRGAMAELDLAPPPAPRTSPPPDIFIVLGEAWWRDPSDSASPIDKLVAAGFSEGVAISPVYGGTTPNAEFEVLTGVPVRSFQAGIIPYQHYQQYFSGMTRSLPRLLTGLGYATHAYHNFTARFWLRDKIYPKFGFSSFDSMDDMNLTVQANDWPTDKGLFERVSTRVDADGPQFHFIVTVETHGPYREDKVRDLIDGDVHPGIADYHDRLSSAVDSLVAFDRVLRDRGKPYILLVFGDHLPGLRLHQWKMGWKSEADPRLHQVTFAVSSNSEKAADLRDRLNGRPLVCFSPVMLDHLALPVTDRYMRHMVKQCGEYTGVLAFPDDAVIQNQLFSDSPQP